MVVDSITWLVATAAASQPHEMLIADAKRRLDSLNADERLLVQHDSPLATAARLLGLEKQSREPAVVKAFHQFAKQRKWLLSA
jgi:hypothetical protein